jgi:hypothetical protein
VHVGRSLRITAASVAAMAEHGAPLEKPKARRFRVVAPE